MPHDAMLVAKLNFQLRSILSLSRVIRIGGMVMALGVSSCSSRPAAIQPVAISPGEASAKAIDLYDKNGDGLLSEDELTSVPALKKYKQLYDQDGDGAVSQREIADRIDQWEEQGVGIRSLNILVLLADRPLPGATVRFVPEPYLGDGPKVATGQCDRNGATKVTVAMEDLPEALRTARLRGIFGGSYKIEVTHPKIKLPSCYNTNTILGEEIARDTVRERVVLKLEKK
jgi:hypothetical protein